MTDRKPYFFPDREDERFFPAGSYVLVPVENIFKRANIVKRTLSSSTVKKMQ